MVSYSEVKDDRCSSRRAEDTENVAVERSDMHLTRRLKVPIGGGFLFRDSLLASYYY